MSEATLEFTDQSFEADVLQSDLPVLVDFWAPWCGPCRMLTPVIDAIAEEYDGRVRVGKMNTQDNQGIATQYQVDNLPTLIIFEDGEVLDRKLGTQTKELIAEWFDTKVLVAPSDTSDSTSV